MSHPPSPSLPSWPGASFDTFGATHAGRVRDHNEDSFCLRPDSGLWVVADGMGGHAAGEVASAAIVEVLGAVGPQESAANLMKACDDGLAEANARIRAYAAQRSHGVMGATVAVLLTFGEHFACVWSGDSRVYLVRQHTILQVTRDHTEAEDLLAQGVLTEAEAKAWPRRNVITRAIGVFEEPMLDHRHGELEPGDIFVLCSDGLTGHVEPDEILAAVSRRRAEIAVGELIGMTLDRGAKDNVTVVVIRYRPEDGATVAPFTAAVRNIWD
ncbi:protein phosphatase 2C domain-containing protein [uncultured Alsobacter sp.]|uniref:PP2C family protein-serine/threonine phosphatase n=1 Tax=uncultured Alsobacter sp. TaxID=1748258 RepID=UPI0025F72872|nr:protein phosphatase 2C domain-containing protein [uncultured Alsobacter sp.]